MTYQETLNYMFNSLPMYHRVGKAAYKADITNTLDMMEHLGHPETRFQSIHVAGTNGKGSVSHFLASILHKTESSATGKALKVGLYTSPHLVDFRERIRINGAMIPEEYVTRFIEKNKTFFDSHQLSFFEMTVGLAFSYFADEQVDIAVIEVGMGGRLDSTNVISPLLSIITNISFDHTQFLGNTLALIAGEKAGIIKEHTPVVIGQTQAETQPVFLSKAAEKEAPIIFADQHYTIEEVEGSSSTELHFRVEREGVTLLSHLVSPMAGSYQLKNLATVMQAVEELRHIGFAIGNDQIALGVANVVKETGLHGRWECFGKAPLIIGETAHNEDGVHEMLAKLQTMQYDDLHLVYGCVNDKDFSHILQLIGNAGKGHASHFYYSQPSVPRGLDVTILAAKAAELGMQGSAFPTVGEAIEEAKSRATAGDLILITGSIFLIADTVEYFNSHEQ